MGKENFWVYILECSNGNFYTGYTNDMERRLSEHVNGTNKAKYTRSFKPVRLAQCWKIYGEKGTALKIESYIKKQKRAVKEDFVRDPLLLVDALSCDEKYDFNSIEVEDTRPCLNIMGNDKSSFQKP